MVAATAFRGDRSAGACAAAERPMLSHHVLALPLPACTEYRHDTGLVLLSYLIAGFAAYSSFHLIDRVRAAGTRTAGLAWLGVAGLAMGLGIWAMHVVAVLAIDTDLPIRFDLPLTLVSAGCAVVASAIALRLVAGAAPSRLRVGLGGTVLGAGVVLMRCLGIAALRMPAQVSYAAPAFAVLVVVAAVLSTAALALLVLVPRLAAGRFPRACLPLLRPLGAAGVGLLLALLQATGTLATCFSPGSRVPAAGVAVQPVVMAVAIGLVALMIAGLALLAAVFDRRAERAEALLLDAVNSSAKGFAIYDRDDRLILCNDGYRRICGDCAPLLVPGMAFETLLRDGVARGRYLDAAGREESWIAERLARRGAGAGPTAQRMSDGTCLLIDEQRMASGGIACCTIEITAMTAAQAALRDSEQRFRDFAELASDWFWEQDAELRFTMVGPGCPPLRPGGNPYIGRRRWEVGGTTLPSQHWESHRRAVMNREPFRDFRYDQVGADGRVVHFSISGVPMFDAAGTFTGYRGTARDVTAEVEAAADLRRAKERAEQVERLLRDAVHSVSEGFVLYDADDRLVMCNDAYRRLYRRSAEMLVPGTRFIDILRHGLAHGQYPDARGREAAWLAERLQLHRAANGAREQLLGDGTWVIVSDRHTSDGGIAGLRTDVTALKAAQAALRESEQRLDRAQEIAGMGSWEYHLASRRLVWSRQMYRLRGLTETEFEPTLEHLGAFIHPEDLAKHQAWFAQLSDGGAQTVEYRIVRRDGEVRIVVAEGRPMRDAAGTVVRLAGTLRDVTERRRTEQQLAQAQKMETVGQLTGGLAHDFNNILGAVVGNLDLIEETLPPGSEAAEFCREALHAALTGAELVRRLLAFARRQTLRPVPTDVAQVLDDVLPLATRTSGEGIAIDSRVPDGLWPALADTVQLESAVLNLVVNARDAMPDGGTLAIEAANVTLDTPLATASGRLDAGAYVVISVADTGTGMSADVLGKAFEPFFTTKAPGAGTGLGLSMVFGTMQQLGGAAHIESEPGQGTTVRLYLPRALEAGAASGRPGVLEEEYLPAGRGRILLVEDDARIRALGTGILRGLGYAVTVADSADAAMAHITRGERFDLLFSDIVMPGERNGIALAHEVRARHPATRVLFTSGFSSPVNVRQQIDLIDADLIPKPYRKAELARAVHAMLVQTAEAAA
jgi:two-component system, cell cycle sensor histidine kinase and response regulator CckA